MPVLVIHGRQDRIIPVAHGLALHSAANDPKRLVLTDTDHNDGILRAGELYLSALEFLDPLLTK
jgi:hypothetical protein